MKLFKTHPWFKVVVGLGCLLSAVSFFLFQGWTSAEGIVGGGTPDRMAILFGFSINFIEAGVIALITAPLAGKVSDIMATWGYNQGRESIHNLEKTLDIIMLVCLLLVYAFDAYTTYLGCVARGYVSTIAVMLAVIQLPMFELLGNAGLWIFGDAVVQLRAVKKAMAVGQSKQEGAVFAHGAG